jgi:hypothetical protein
VQLFLKECFRVKLPLVYAFVIFQAETKYLIEYLLPTLTSRRTKWLGIKPTLKFAVPLANAILPALDSTFKGYDRRHEFIVASITFP